jgi:nucleoside-diphosphate-sugar epimerase
VRIVITGSEGNVGRRLKAAFPGSTGIDIVRGADIIADLGTVDYERVVIRTALANADAVVHLAASPNVNAPDDVHWHAVASATCLFAACAHLNVPRVVVASSDWAEPKAAMTEAGLTVNTYGHSKRVMEALAAMYALTPGRSAVALRVGWIPRDPAEVANAAPWLLANYWDDARLIAEFRQALGL